MQRNLVKKNVYKAGKNTPNQELVNQHMSNHYRRILNAKKAIDTSPPYCYQKKKALRATTTTPSVRNIRAVCRNISPALTERSISTNSCKGSCWGAESYAGRSRYHASCVPENPNPDTGGKFHCIDMDLIDKITYDTKNGPGAYCDEGWLEIKAQHNDKSYKTGFSGENKNDDSNTKGRVQVKTPETTQKRKYATQIKNKNSPEIPSKRSLEAPNCKCANIPIYRANTGGLDFKKASENPKENQTSSRDSAYNGGVSSLPESRSPTPDQRGKKECCCKENGQYFCRTKESKIHKRRESVKIVKQAEDLSSSGLESSRDMPTKSDAEQLKESLKKMKEDELYIKFIQDITVEILEKCLYTNKALIKVMKKHIMNNLETLDKERMMKEVENLRIQLGIPEDKNIFQLDCDSVESASVFNTYPVISDSEFSIPKNLREGEKDFPKSVSEVMSNRDPSKEFFFDSESSDSNTISVIQLGKTSREKRKGKSGAVASAELIPSQGNSADESDQSPERPNRRRRDSRNSRNEKRLSYTSSENEDFEKKQMNSDKSDESEIISCTGKKTRSVSFWNNDYANRGIEIKEINTISCSKRKASEEEKKNKLRDE